MAERAETATLRRLIIVPRKEESRGEVPGASGASSETVQGAEEGGDGELASGGRLSVSTFSYFSPPFPDLLQLSRMFSNLLYPSSTFL